MTDNEFDKFLRDNKEKIDSMSIKNPTISKDDEWYDETEWDELFNSLGENK